jgi:hypothetical protein
MPMTVSVRKVLVGKSKEIAREIARDRVGKE